MPIYTYECGEHGVCDVFQRGIGPDSYSCPDCSQPMTNVLAAPAVITVERNWNEKANDYQTHGPYYQAKSQLENINRQAAERGESHSPITEEAIQVAAKAIDEAARNPQPSVEQQQIQRIRRDQMARRSKQTD
ncbi:hypothetical protein LCGC14_1066340 [marine sediment metagenome]|uniref:Uncharacterized protein n=1 Tax=marine sediment metagenome TaxID=412755 RepID=A0A0F9MJJ5_9ZZZZ